MKMPPFWPLTQAKASDLKDALVSFHPQLGETVERLNCRWNAGLLPLLLEPMAWAHVVTLGEHDPSETVPEAVLRLSREFAVGSIIPDRLHRGAVLIPNGRYILEAELNLRYLPWVDLFGESREGTVLTYGSLKREATIWTKASNTTIGHMTVERTGEFDEPYHARYCIHNNTPSYKPRTVVFFDMECRIAPEVRCNGIGTGIGEGNLNLYVAVKANTGFFSGNGDDVRESIQSGHGRIVQKDHGAIVYLDCEGIIRHWNIGSGQPDIMMLYGGNYPVVEVRDFAWANGGGNSETELLIGPKTNITTFDCTPETKITHLEA